MVTIENTIQERRSTLKALIGQLGSTSEHIGCQFNNDPDWGDDHAWDNGGK
jgi:hypothetical protein